MDIVGSVGIVLDVPKCPECGGYPVRVDWLFDISDEGRTRVLGSGKTPVRVCKERRTYLHCNCDRCTTDWHRPEYDPATGRVRVSAFELAKESYRRGIFVQRTRPGCGRKKQMV